MSPDVSVLVQPLPGYRSHFHFKKDIDKEAHAPNRCLKIMSQKEGLREKGFFDLSHLESLKGYNGYCKKN